jgi:hypothetical protein
MEMSGQLHTCFSNPETAAQILIEPDVGQNAEPLSMLWKREKSVGPARK